jgi:hypothetical protein
MRSELLTALLSRSAVVLTVFLVLEVLASAALETLLFDAALRVSVFLTL